MGVESLVCSIVVGFLAFIVGWMKGCEDEYKRIRKVFSSEEGYDWESFANVLVKHEKELENAQVLNDHF